jgi:fructuronate reductase
LKALSFQKIAELPPAIRRPAYDPRPIGIGIVHLGIGAFHRAHQAIYTDDALAHKGGDWGICGVSLRNPDVRDRMMPQDGLYTAIEKSPGGIRRRIVGSVREVLFQGDDRARIEARLADPATRIVSLTVTEKGYCHDPASGRLNFEHPDIAHDLAHPNAPVSVVGLLVAAFAARMKTDAGPLSVVCCDNLPHNGKVLRGLVAAFGEAREPALARWIDTHAAFPSTMVDRIVPATTAADIADNDAVLGVHDAAPVVFEPFEKWVIEDEFATPRPAWEAGGAQFVVDVAPFEAMKLRFLNASHSAFAYLGYLAGHEYIYQVAGEPAFVAFMRRFMEDEVTPTVKVPPGVDLLVYRDALVERFRNPALPHRTQQIAMDGFAEIAAAPARHRARQSRRRARHTASPRSPSPAGCDTWRASTRWGGRSWCRIRSARSSPTSPRRIATIRRGSRVDCSRFAGDSATISPPIRALSRRSPMARQAVRRWRRADRRARVSA